MKGFNSKCQINRTIEITDYVKSVMLSREEKNELKNIESLILTYFLNEETTGLKANDSISLIYVYQIKIKTNLIPYKFIKALDKKTKVHTLFEIVGIDELTYLIANKKITANVVVGDYYEKTEEKELNCSEWVTLKTVEDIYRNIFAFVVNLNVRENESVAEIVDRKNSILALQEKFTKLEHKKKSEVQFNKKVAINEKMREIKNKIKDEMI